MKASDIVELGIAQVLEGRRIFSELTVNENLRLGGHTASKNIKENIDRVFDLFPLLAPRSKDVAGYLSGGEQQMLAIGRALMSNPKCLLLDEPSLGLAPKLVDQIKEFIVEINQQGVSVLLVEQNANMALSIATHGYIMETGNIVMDNTPEKLLKDEDVREFYLGLNAEGTKRKSFKDVKHYKTTSGGLPCLAAKTHLGKKSPHPNAVILTVIPLFFLLNFCITSSSISALSAPVQPCQSLISTAINCDMRSSAGFLRRWSICRLM